jgi:hypothetical protein
MTHWLEKIMAVHRTFSSTPLETCRVQRRDSNVQQINIFSAVRSNGSEQGNLPLLISFWRWYKKRIAIYMIQINTVEPPTPPTISYLRNSITLLLFWERRTLYSSGNTRVQVTCCKGIKKMCKNAGPHNFSRRSGKICNGVSHLVTLF